MQFVTTACHSRNNSINFIFPSAVFSALLFLQSCNFRNICSISGCLVYIFHLIIRTGCVQCVEYRLSFLHCGPGFQYYAVLRKARRCIQIRMIQDFFTADLNGYGKIFFFLCFFFCGCLRLCRIILCFFLRNLLCGLAVPCSSCGLLPALAHLLSLRYLHCQTAFRLPAFCRSGILPGNLCFFR